MTHLRQLFRSLPIIVLKRKAAIKKNKYVDSLPRTAGGKVHMQHRVKNLCGALFPEELDLITEMENYADSNGVFISGIQQQGNTTLLNCRFNLYEYPALYKSFGALCFVVEITISSGDVLFEMHDVRRLYQGIFQPIELLLIPKKKNTDWMTLAVVTNNLWEHLRSAASYIAVRKKVADRVSVSRELSSTMHMQRS